jgi:plastocyanin
VLPTSAPTSRPAASTPTVAPAPTLTVQATPTVVISREADATPRLFQVEMVDDGYDPWELSVTVGSSVVWRNVGQKLHDVASTSSAWAAAPVSPGGSFRHTFHEPGLYPYFCSYHAVEMRGEITVRQPSSTPPSTKTIVPVM